MLPVRLIFTTLLLSLLLACQSPAPGFSPVPLQGRLSPTLQRQSAASIAGDVRYHRQFSSQYLQHRRDVVVWLPPGYEQSQERYPVLYMHDGNNLFDRNTAFGGREWRVDETAMRLVEQGQIRPVIIVAVANTAARMDEYTWHSMDWDGQQRGGQGANYGRFLAQELKPMIDREYRTRPEREQTAVMGSSLGGLISFYLGKHHGDTFGLIGAMSPSVWWAERQAVADVQGLRRDLKIWVDMGTQEGRQPEVMLQDAKDFTAALEQRGYQHFHNLAFHIEPGGQHNEQAWADRLERPLRFFFEAP